MDGLFAVCVHLQCIIRQYVVFNQLISCMPSQRNAAQCNASHNGRVWQALWPSSQQWRCEQRASPGGASSGGARFDISVLFLPLCSFTIVLKPVTCHGSAADEPHCEGSSPV